MRFKRNTKKHARTEVGQEGEETPIRPYEKETADWFESRMGEVLKQNESHFGQFRLSDALMGMYKLVWDDFCSTFLEGVKPPYGEKISSEGLSIAKEFLSNLMKMIHPIMPFISEEIHQGINPGSDCITASYPKIEQGSSDDLDVPLSMITEVRNLRVQQQLSPKQSLKVEIKNPSKEILHYSSMIVKLANIEIVDGFEDASNLVMLPIQTMELWIELEKEINKEEEISKIDQELKHLTGFLMGVMKKLGNEKFMANAKPDVIEREQKKKEDAETKIKNLEQQKQVLLNK